MNAKLQIWKGRRRAAKAEFRHNSRVIRGKIELLEREQAELQRRHDHELYALDSTIETKLAEYTRKHAAAAEGEVLGVALNAYEDDPAALPPVENVAVVRGTVEVYFVAYGVRGGIVFDYDNAEPDAEWYGKFNLCTDEVEGRAAVDPERVTIDVEDVERHVVGGELESMSCTQCRSYFPQHTEEVLEHDWDDAPRARITFLVPFAVQIGVTPTTDGQQDYTTLIDGFPIRPRDEILEDPYSTSLL